MIPISPPRAIGPFGIATRLRTVGRMAAASVVFTAGALTGAAQASTDLLTNGSFEQGIGGIGSFSGWQAVLGDAATFVDSSGTTGPHYGQASDGLWSAFFGSTASSGGATLRQTLATTAGQAYLLSFDLADDNAGAAAANGLQGLIDGLAIVSLTNLASQDYSRRQIGFVATGGTTLLAFSAYNDTGYLELDRVSVVAAVPAVPEAAIVWLLAPGVAGLAVIGRRRSTAIPAPAKR